MWFANYHLPRDPELKLKLRLDIPLPRVFFALWCIFEELILVWSEINAPHCGKRMGKQDVATWLYLISGAAPGRTVGLLDKPPKNGKNKKWKKRRIYTKNTPTC